MPRLIFNPPSAFLFKNFAEMRKKKLAQTGVESMKRGGGLKGIGVKSL